MMKWFLRNWYYLSAVIGLAIIAYTLTTWGERAYLQSLMLLNTAVIFFHFFEEFGFPGGFPAFCNTIFAPKGSTAPDRYPLNQMSALWINWGTAIFMYLIPAVFYEQIWLGLMPIFFGGLAQLIVHGIVNNKLLKSYYNAGLATTLFGHLPIMIAYIAYIEQHDLVQWWEYISGIVLMVVWYVGVIRILIAKIWENPQSPYVFTPAEMNRFKPYRQGKV